MPTASLLTTKPQISENVAQSAVRKRSFAASTAAWAIGLFLSLNIGMQAWELKPSKRQPNHVGCTTVTQDAYESAAKLFLQKHAAGKTVALLGSSLVLAPFWSADVAHYKNVGDCWHHHEAQWLEQNLSQAGCPGTGAINFGLPGLVVSDAYLIADKLFTAHNAPSVLVYGIAPRDFMDDFLGAHTQTPLFEKLVTAPDALQLGDLYFAKPEARFDYLLQKLVYLYGKRGRYQTRFNRSVDRIAQKLSKTQTSPVDNDADVRSLGFLQEQNRPFVMAASVREYKARYKTFNPVQFETQKRFLEAMLDLTKQRHIPLVLMNMPLTDLNMQLMPAGLYDRYLQAVRQLASSHNVPLIDLQNDDHYPEELFYDTVHLNAKGGVKLSEKVASLVSAELSAAAKKQQ